MERESINELLNSWIDNKKQVLAKVTYVRDFRPNEVKHQLALFHEKDKFGYYMWGHPINIDTNWMEAGAFGCFLEEIKNIEPVTADDYINWRKQYDEFHQSVIAEKGYDFCEEIFNNVILYTND